MPAFSGDEINDAKRRVQEMHERARQYTEEAPPPPPPKVKEVKTKKTKKANP